MRAAVAGLADADFGRPSGCTGWLVRDLVCHLIIDAQDVLITLVTPTDKEPTRDAVTYWDIAETPPTGDDPLDALTVRLAAAYGEPRLLELHLDDVGSAAGRAAVLADPDQRVSTRDEVLTTGDYLSAYVLEWTLHHLDLVAHLPRAAQPPEECLAPAGAHRRSRIPGDVLRPGRPVDRHRTPRRHRRGRGGPGRAVRKTADGPRLRETGRRHHRTATRSAPL